MSNTSVSPDLTKLSVPQLRAICREKKLTGYSKLPKAGLLQILNSVTSTATQLSDAKAASTAGRPTESKGKGKAKPRHNLEKDVPNELSSTDAQIYPAQSDTRYNAAQQSVNTSASVTGIPSTSISRQPTVASIITADITNLENIPSGTQLSSVTPLRSSQHCASSTVQHTVTSASPLSQVHNSLNNLRRPGSVLELSSPQKRTKIAHIPTVQTNFFSPVEPPSPVSLLGSHNPPAPQAVINRIKSNQKLKSGSTRFKPLLLKKPLPVTTPLLSSSADPMKTPRSAHATTEHLLSSATDLSALRYLELPPSPEVPALKHITLPPSLSQRKRVPRWALVLSYVRPADRKNCCLVSRMIRYAVYLSAVSILKRDFPGKRLNGVLQQYSPTMSDFWPYLRLRQSEVKERYHIYQKSFLGRTLLGRDPLVDKIWASGDSQKQLTIAFRFILTRLWFATAIGGKEQDTWLQEKVVDVQEVVPNQIWMIKVQHGQDNPQSLYILDATCEVVGNAEVLPNPTDSDSETRRPSSNFLRADWTGFIQQHVTNKSVSPLLTHLKWAHFEEYDKGISRFWLKRIEFEGDLGFMKRTVAERYVLACVIGNGVSGCWMSTAEMAQESAGLASRIEGTSRKAPEINLFLPAHHHVESVHFTAAKHILLHPAIAIIQTLSREYYILRDNGMEIGCEEDGVRGVWMHLLRCTNKGLPLWTA